VINIQFQYEYTQFLYKQIKIVYSIDCLDMYPMLKGLNSQTNEQANAGLKRIKDQLSYMTAENFFSCSYITVINNAMSMISY
jgi:hypothetical protein